MFRWIGITDRKNMPEIIRILDLNKIKVVFMDTDEKGKVRYGCHRLAKKAAWILSNYGVK